MFKIGIDEYITNIYSFYYAQNHLTVSNNFQGYTFQ